VKIKRNILLLSTLIVGVVSYSIGYHKANKVNEEYKKQIEVEYLNNNLLPMSECEFSETCANYQIFDTDGDGWTDQETIIIEKIGMTQFAGRVLIIDEGEIVFTSNTKMRIWVDPIRSFDYNNGFIIQYSTEPNSNTDIARDFYKYIDGEYVVVKTIDKNTPRVTYYGKLNDISTPATSFYQYDIENKKIKTIGNEKVWFYASPGYTFGDSGSDEWEDLIKNNKNSLFKIMGVQLEECDYDNPEICYENIVVKDIEIVK